MAHTRQSITHFKASRYSDDTIERDQQHYELICNAMSGLSLQEKNDETLKLYLRKLERIFFCDTPTPIPIIPIPSIINRFASVLHTIVMQKRNNPTDQAPTLLEQLLKQLKHLKQFIEHYTHTYNDKTASFLINQLGKIAIHLPEIDKDHTPNNKCLLTLVSTFITNIQQINDTTAEKISDKTTEDFKYLSNIISGVGALVTRQLLTIESTQANKLFGLLLDYKSMSITGINSAIHGLNQYCHNANPVHALNAVTIIQILNHLLLYLPDQTRLPYEPKSLISYWSYITIHLGTTVENLIDQISSITLNKESIQKIEDILSKIKDISNQVISDPPRLENICRIIYGLSKLAITILPNIGIAHIEGLLRQIEKCQIEHYFDQHTSSSEQKHIDQNIAYLFLGLGRFSTRFLKPFHEETCKNIDHLLKQFNQYLNQHQPQDRNLLTITTVADSLIKMLSENLFNDSTQNAIITHVITLLEHIPVQDTLPVQHATKLLYIFARLESIGQLPKLKAYLSHVNNALLMISQTKDETLIQHSVYIAHGLFGLAQLIEQLWLNKEINQENLAETIKRLITLVPKLNNLAPHQIINTLYGAQKFIDPNALYCESCWPPSKNNNTRLAKYIQMVLTSLTSSTAQTLKLNMMNFNNFLKSLSTFVEYGMITDIDEFACTALLRQILTLNKQQDKKNTLYLAGAILNLARLIHYAIAPTKTVIIKDDKDGALISQLNKAIEEFMASNTEEKCTINIIYAIALMRYHGLRVTFPTQTVAILAKEGRPPIEIHQLCAAGWYSCCSFTAQEKKLKSAFNAFITNPNNLKQATPASSNTHESILKKLKLPKGYTLKSEHCLDGTFCDMVVFKGKKPILVIELDGIFHVYNPYPDEKRDKQIERRYPGLGIFRISPPSYTSNTKEWVIQYAIAKIKEAITQTIKGGLPIQPQYAISTPMQGKKSTPINRNQSSPVSTLFCTNKFKLLEEEQPQHTGSKKPLKKNSQGPHPRPTSHRRQPVPVH